MEKKPLSPGKLSVARLKRLVRENGVVKHGVIRVVLAGATRSFVRDSMTHAAFEAAYGSFATWALCWCKECILVRGHYGDGSHELYDGHLNYERRGGKEISGVWPEERSKSAAKRWKEYHAPRRLRYRSWPLGGVGEDAYTGRI